MALAIRKNLGMLVLAIYLILVGLAGLVTFSMPAIVMPVLAIAAGILLLLGK